METSTLPIVHGIQKVNSNVFRVYHRRHRRFDYKAVNRKRPGVFNLGTEGWWKSGIKPTRDTQRQRAYNAEFSVRPLVKQRTFKNVRQLAVWFRNLIESAWFQRRFPHFFSLKLKYEPGTKAAHACPVETKPVTENGRIVTHVTRGWIGFSSWAMGKRGEHGGELIMLHELAHAILPREQWHGRRWARTFLELVKHVMGRDAHKLLQAAFREKGVRFNPGRPKRVLSPEHKAKLAACRRSPKSLQSAAAGNVPVGSVVPVLEVIA